MEDILLLVYIYRHAFQMHDVHLQLLGRHRRKNLEWQMFKRVLKYKSESMKHRRNIQDECPLISAVDYEYASSNIFP